MLFPLVPNQPAPGHSRTQIHPLLPLAFPEASTSLFLRCSLTVPHQETFPSADINAVPSRAGAVPAGAVPSHPRSPGEPAGVARGAAVSPHGRDAARHRSPRIPVRFAPSRNRRRARLQPPPGRESPSHSGDAPGPWHCQIQHESRREPLAYLALFKKYIEVLSPSDCSPFFF